MRLKPCLPTDILVTGQLRNKLLQMVQENEADSTAANSLLVLMEKDASGEQILAAAREANGQGTLSAAALEEVKLLHPELKSSTDWGDRSGGR